MGYAIVCWWMLVACALPALALAEEVVQSCSNLEQANGGEVPGGQKWQSIGPGGGGWITAIAWDPIDEDIIHVTSDVGGYYFSDDRGGHFETRNRGLRDYYVQSIAVHPRDNQTILLGTKGGVYKSTDQGKHWRLVRAGFPPVSRSRYSAPVDALAYDELNPSVVYAGIGSRRHGQSAEGSLFRSSNGAETWSRMVTVPISAGAMVMDVKVSPHSSSIILVATEKGVLRSGDEGRSWKDVSGVISERHVERVAFSRQDPKVVYVTVRAETKETSEEIHPGRVYRSMDAGRSWRLLEGNGLGDKIGSGGKRRSTSSVSEIVVDPRDSNLVLVGDDSWVTPGMYSSRNGGVDWSVIAMRKRGGARKTNVELGWIDMWNLTVTALDISKVNPSRVAFGTPGHLFMSLDGGRTWLNRYSTTQADGGFFGTGLETTVIHDVIPDPVRPGRLYTCYFDVGLLISEDSGRSFRRSFNGMRYPSNCFTLVVDPDEPDNLIASTGKHNNPRVGEVVRSEDGGRTWQKMGQVGP